MAALDSASAVFVTAEGFLLTRNGGRTWQEWDSPLARTTQALAFTGGDRLLAAGDGIAMIEGFPEGRTLYRTAFDDTLRSS
jgi:photosystem II stability/assembly factor-like uncharacterized protein